ncbi:MAG: H-NS histone family protein [Burkholderiaceae bacterium]
MSSYRELQAQIEQLQKRAEEARQKEIDQVVAEIKAKMEEYGLSVDDLQHTQKKRGARKAGTSTVAPKYRNEATGESWSGRGKPPKWIAGKDKSKFLIK